MSICIINPFLKLFATCYRTSWIIWETKIDDIRYFFPCRRNFWHKTIFFCTRHDDDVLFATKHNICIHINWIYRITNCNLIIYIKNITNITAVRFCTVRKENFILSHFNSTICIIVFQNLF